jgi:hypothetical protein
MSFVETVLYTLSIGAQLCFIHAWSSLRCVEHRDLFMKGYEEKYSYPKWMSEWLSVTIESLTIYVIIICRDPWSFLFLM